VALGSLVLANPAALWALLAIPALLSIYLLQQKALRMETSTLFLLVRIAPETSTGRRVEWIRSSLPLWLQLLAILVTVWVLVEPSFVDESSMQRAVIVVDSSASMSVFREAMIAEVERITGEMEKSAARTEWIVVDSDVGKKTIYSGAERAQVLEAMRTFDANGGAHDFGPALSLAIGLARGKGPVLFVTDHEVAVPSGVLLLAVGRPLENAGFTGLSVQRTASGTEWTAMVKNHGRSIAQRTLSIDGAEPRQLSLDPGEVRTLRGTFPAKADRARLVLGADAFPLDDTAPLVRPRAKVLRLYVEPEAQALEAVQRLIAGLEASALITDPRGADLVIAVRKANEGTPANAIVFLGDDAPERKNELAPVLAERGPLTDGLAWSGLLRRKMSSFDLGDATPVLWQGDRPLVAVRTSEGKRALIVSFDPRHSNAERVPSFAVLLLRFVESVRNGKAELEARNVETHQPLAVALRGEDEVVLRNEKAEQRMSSREASSLIAPSEPGFFFVQQGDVMLLAGAARFGDLREADLSEATTRAPEIEMLREIALRNAWPDPLRALWILLAAGACLGAWLAQARRRA
jgi:hypothetical protein